MHVRRAGSDAKIWLEPSITLAESDGFNSRDLSVIISLVAQHREEIEGKWHEYFGNERSI